MGFGRGCLFTSRHVLLDILRWAFCGDRTRLDGTGEAIKAGILQKREDLSFSGTASISKITFLLRRLSHV